MSNIRTYGTLSDPYASPIQYIRLSEVVYMWASRRTERDIWRRTGTPYLAAGSLGEVEKILQDCLLDDSE